MTLPDQIVGCLLGGALGDALGGSYENCPAPVVLSADAPLRLSDDTQLTLATCEAIVAAQGSDPASVATAFATQFKQRRLRGLGASTLKALQELAAGGHWALVGSKGDRSAGNGPATRIAPLAFLLDPAEPMARQTIRDVCRITHHNDEAYCGALAVLAAVRLASTRSWCGESGLVQSVAAMLPDSAVRDRLREISSVSADRPLSDVAHRYGTSGYVVESVPCALIAAERLEKLGFRGVIEEVIKAGGDTDSIASIAGQICGTCVGQQALPTDWLACLPEREQVVKIADSFSRYVTVVAQAKLKTMSPTHILPVLERLIDPLARCFTADVARKIIALRADEITQARLDELAEKATADTLSESERTEYAAYVSAIDFISILQAKSRNILSSGASL